MTTVPDSQITYRLEGKLGVVFERRFIVPPEEVFSALVDPDPVSGWQGSQSTTLEVVEMDVRPGSPRRATTSFLTPIGCGRGFDDREAMQRLRPIRFKSEGGCKGSDDGVVRNQDGGLTLCDERQDHPGSILE